MGELDRNKEAPTSISVQQAADVLNVSRQYLKQLLSRGDIQSARPGRHRRVDAADLARFKRALEAERAAALDDLASADAEYLR